MGQTYPMPLPPAAYIPAYLGNVSYNWPYNGIVGDPALPGNDVNVATANATTAYEPKNQGNKANRIGVPLAVVITEPLGWIGPLEPYVAAPTPTLTNLAPPNRVADEPLDITLVLTGTNFMASSQIEFNGGDERSTFVSPTELRTLIRGGPLTPGAYPVRVFNANKPSNAIGFTITAAE